MTKSNVRSVRMRQANRRLTIVDRKERIARREHNRPPTRRNIEQFAMAAMALGWFRVGFQHIADLFTSLFNSPATAISSLNLTRETAFETGQRRDAGAAWIRATFDVPRSFKMRSTRDGRVV